MEMCIVRINLCVLEQNNDVGEYKLNKTNLSYECRHTGNMHVPHTHKEKGHAYIFFSTVPMLHICNTHSHTHTQMN